MTITVRKLLSILRRADLDSKVGFVPEILRDNQQAKSVWHLEGVSQGGGMTVLGINKIVRKNVRLERVDLPDIRPTRVPPYISEIIRTAPIGMVAPTLLGTLLNGPKKYTWFDLARAPHILVAGATGSGKSVWLRSMIVSLTATMRPDQLRMILIDPKRVEFSKFKDMQHTAAYLNDEINASKALHSLLKIMEHRYDVLESEGLRDISETDLPRMVVVIDEFADLVLATRKTDHEVETVLSRLLALGRAVGIHVVLATQRPDANVVTGLIKANTPTRIAFHTTSSVESRIILDTSGAEALLGAGQGLVSSSQIENTVTAGEPVGFMGHMFPTEDVDEYIRYQAKHSDDSVGSPVHAGHSQH